MVQSLEQYLRGRWTLERQVSDYRADMTGEMRGACLFRAGMEPRALLYEERGKLAFGPFEHEASRDYLWRFRDGHRAAVYFKDGSFFHNLRIVNGEATARHECGQDIYEAAYRFDGPNQWRAKWRVRGPRKDYLLDSVFVRGR